MKVVALTVLLTALEIVAIPTDVFAANCEADNGASCTCAGDCKATALHCWCLPPAN
jgi:hypothetical protein